MHLKRPEDVQWRDLTKVESPEIARAWAESNLPLAGHELHWVQGLEEVIRDDLSHALHVWDSDSRALLLERLEKAEVFLVHGLGSDPLRAPVWREEGALAEYWVIDPSLLPITQLNIQRMLDYASGSRGIWEPIIQKPAMAAAPPPKETKAPQKLTVTNPQWEHIDEKRAQDCPDAAAPGDKVRLMADVSGAADGAVATFRVFDTSLSPPARVAAVRGEVQDGVATAEWEIKRDRQGAKLEFGGMVRRVSSERAEIPFKRPALRLGIFFDGTGNDKANRDTYSNVAKLSEAYEEDQKSIFALYIRGVGTDVGLFDDDLGDWSGAAFGRGAETRVEGMLWKMVQAIDRYRRRPGGGELPDRILLDVFGFSRGAATARLFINVIKQHAYTLADEYAALTPDKFSLQFVGLFDTVGSFGMPGNDTDPGKSFVIEPEWVDGKVVHFVADDEYRKNFDLQSVFDGQNSVPCNMESGSLSEWVVPGAHSDVGGGYSSGREHGCDGNQLGRIHLHRMHKEALNEQVPFPPLGELTSERTEHWHIEQPVAEVYDEVMQAYKSRPGLQEEQKKLRELRRGLEWAEYLMETLPRRFAGPSGDARRRIEYRELNERIEDLKEALQKQRAVVTGHFATTDEAKHFFRAHSDLHTHVHHSHAPVNETTGMGPEVLGDGRLRREVFYKPFASLKQIPWWVGLHPTLIFLVKTNYEPSEFDDQ